VRYILSEIEAALALNAKSYSFLHPYLTIPIIIIY